MQPLLIKVDIPRESSFSVNRYSYDDRFPGIWQFHSEYELTLILQGSGTRMAGDHIDRFEPGDLIFIGKNLPHTWRNNDRAQVVKSEALVVHFEENFLGDHFFDLPEMKGIRALLQKSRRGLKVCGNANKKVENILLDIEKGNSAERLILLLSLLLLLSESKELITLSSEGFTNSINQSDSERLNKVYEYIMNHFREDINLPQAAAIANLSPTAFSRYFKSRTRQSFSEFMIQLKIGYACKLLMKEEMTVTQACFESGFQNLSNFNQQFRRATGMPPKKYQLLHMK